MIWMLSFFGCFYLIYLRWKEKIWWANRYTILMSMPWNVQKNTVELIYIHSGPEETTHECIHYGSVVKRREDRLKAWVWSALIIKFSESL